MDENLEEQIEEPITEPADIVRYQDDRGYVYEFQKFPNLGRFKKFSSPLITNYVVTTVRLGAETIYGKVIMPKQMERMIATKLHKLDS